MEAAEIQFPRGHEAVKIVVLGMSKPERIRQDLGWFSMQIPPGLWGRLKTERLIRKDASLPAWCDSLSN